MRILLVLLTVSTFAGCGSKSSDSLPVAGVPLAINNPTTGKQDSKSTVATSVANPAVSKLAEKAKVAAASGQRAAAIEALSQAIGIDPRNSSLFQMRAEVYTSMGEDANARADLSLAIACDQGNAELYNVRGYFLLTRGAVDDAAVDFDKALELNPEFAAAFNNRGLIYLASGDFEKAIADFNKAIRLDGKYPDALNNRGYAHLKSGDPTAALVDLEATVKLKPDYTTAWNNCGLAYMQLENFDKAIEAFSEAVRLAPFDSRWLNHRRAAFQKLERFEEANIDGRRLQWLADLGNLTQRANAQAGNADVWVTRAEHLAQGNEFAAAAQDFTRALKLEPANTDALNGRALAQLNAGDLRQAITDCDVSLVTKPTTTAFAIRGDAWFALKNYDQAIQDFEAGQKFDETVAEAYRQRAAQRTEAGKQELAESDLKRAAEIDDALSGRLKSASADRKPVPFPEN